MPKINMVEKLWLEFVKHKWKTLLVGSEEYNARRKAFYVGAFALLGVIQKAPDSLVTEVVAEISAEVKRGEGEILKNIKLN